MPFSRVKSCRHCRTSKLRCNRELPACSRCLERGIACTYDDRHASRPGPYTRPSAAGLGSDLGPTLGSSAGMISQDQSIDVPVGDVFAGLPDAYVSPAQLNRDFDAGWVGFDQPNNSAFNPTKVFEPGLASFGDVCEPHISTLEREPTAQPVTAFWLDQDSGQAVGPDTNGLSERMIRRHAGTPSQWTLRRRPIIQGCMLTNVVMGQLTSYPRLMTLGDRLPPFIHPPCYTDETLMPDCNDAGKHVCLNKDLAICASMVEVFDSRTVSNADFVWKSIYSERERLHQEYRHLDVHGQLAALQAVIIYILLQAQEFESAERNGAGQLLITMIEIFTSVTEKVHWDADMFTTKPDRREWILRESIRRIVGILAIIELCFEGLIPPHASRGDTDTPPYRSFQSVPLSCPRDLWETRSNVAWRRMYNKYMSSRATEKVLTAGDLIDLDKAGCFRNTGGPKQDFDIMPDAVSWCESFDSLGSLTWMVLPLQRWRRRDDGSDRW